MKRDLSRSRAVLIGNSTYQAHPRIPNLPAARTCVNAMAQLLTGDLCGWPSDRITAIVDVVAPHTLASRVLAAVRDTEDVLLVYYVGHGIRTSEGQLALAVGESDPDPEAMPHTSMLYENLSKILRGCRAATKLVILDCCHAELANKANYVFQSADIAEAYPVDGLYFIGASAKDKKAKAPLDGSLTYFTDAFIRVVQSGIPDRPPTLRLDQIFLELRAQLLRAGLPEPVESGTRGAYQFPFARNAAPPEVLVDYEAECRRLREQLADPAARSAKGLTPGQDIDPGRRAPTVNKPPVVRADRKARPRAAIVAKTNARQDAAGRPTPPATNDTAHNPTSYVPYQDAHDAVGQYARARRYKSAPPHLAIALFAGAGFAYSFMPWITASWLPTTANSASSSGYLRPQYSSINAWTAGVSAWWLSPVMLLVAGLFCVIARNPIRRGTKRALYLAIGLGGAGAIALPVAALHAIRRMEATPSTRQVEGYVPGNGCFVGIGCAAVICVIACWALLWKRRPAA